MNPVHVFKALIVCSLFFSSMAYYGGEHLNTYLFLSIILGASYFIRSLLWGEQTLISNLEFETKDKIKEWVMYFGYLVPSEKNQKSKVRELEKITSSPKKLISLGAFILITFIFIRMAYKSDEINFSGVTFIYLASFLAILFSTYLVQLLIPVFLSMLVILFGVLSKDFELNPYYIGYVVCLFLTFFMFHQLNKSKNILSHKFRNIQSALKYCLLFLFLLHIANTIIPEYKSSVEKKQAQKKKRTIKDRLSKKITEQMTKSENKQVQQEIQKLSQQYDEKAAQQAMEQFKKMEGKFPAGGGSQGGGSGSTMNTQRPVKDMTVDELMQQRGQMANPKDWDENEIRKMREQLAQASKNMSQQDVNNMQKDIEEFKSSGEMPPPMKGQQTTGKLDKPQQKERLQQLKKIQESLAKHQGDPGQGNGSGNGSTEGSDQGTVESKGSMGSTAQNSAQKELEEIQNQKIEKEEGFKKKKEKMKLNIDKTLNVMGAMVNVMVFLALAYLVYFFISKLSKKKKFIDQEWMLDKDKIKQLKKDLHDLRKQKLSERQEVIKSYYAFLDLMDTTPHGRKPSVPPTAYFYELEEHLPKIKNDVEYITDQFCDTFYADYKVRSIKDFRRSRDNILDHLMRVS